MKALIYKSTGSWYIAKTEDGEVYNARIKGSFKIDGITSTNPLAVGDEVDIEPEEGAEKTAMITEIYQRKNYVARVSPHNKNQHHIIASNLDQALLFATLKDPKTSNGFIDRFLVSAESFHIPSIIVFNKTDLYKNKEILLAERYKEIYGKAGYQVIEISLTNGTGVQELISKLSNKTTLISGHSGVGKSTFLNFVFPQKKIKNQ